MKLGWKLQWRFKTWNVLDSSSKLVMVVRAITHKQKIYLFISLLHWFAVYSTVIQLVWSNHFSLQISPALLKFAIFCNHPLYIITDRTPWDKAIPNHLKNGPGKNSKLFRHASVSSTYPCPFVSPLVGHTFGFPISCRP